MCHQFDIRPVERDCICSAHSPDGPHDPSCNTAFRARFFGAVQGVRTAFAEGASERQAVEALGAASALN